MFHGCLITAEPGQHRQTINKGKSEGKFTKGLAHKDHRDPEKETGNNTKQDQHTDLVKSLGLGFLLGFAGKKLRITPFIYGRGSGYDRLRSPERS